ASNLCNQGLLIENRGTVPQIIIYCYFGFCYLLGCFLSVTFRLVRDIEFEKVTKFHQSFKHKVFTKNGFRVWMALKKTVYVYVDSVGLYILLTHQNIVANAPPAKARLRK